jgi:hypothetical protein
MMLDYIIINYVCMPTDLCFFVLQDFYHLDTETNEIDLVLSTTELWNMLEEQAQGRYDYDDDSGDNVDVWVHMLVSVLVRI